MDDKADSEQNKEQSAATPDVEAAELLVKRNIFSSQWEDSDAIFVVEETKFHVHRVLLSLMSPVFKPMFNSNFREKIMSEIPLPGKKANIFLSFLLIVYSKEDFNEITMTNVIDLLALGHEYSVERVEKDCRKFLMHANPDDSQVVLDALLITQRDPEPDGFQTWCHEKLCSLKVDELERMKGYEDLNTTSLKGILVPRLKKLQTCLEEVFPRFMGLVNIALHLPSKRRPYPAVSTCDEHYPNGVSCRFRGDAVGMRDCALCKKMFNDLEMKIVTENILFGFCDWRYDNFHFDQSINRVACDMMEILGTP